MPSKNGIQRFPDALNKTFGMSKQYIGQKTIHCAALLRLELCGIIWIDLRNITADRYRQLRTIPENNLRIIPICSERRVTHGSVPLRTAESAERQKAQKGIFSVPEKSQKGICCMVHKINIIHYKFSNMHTVYTSNYAY